MDPKNHHPTFFAELHHLTHHPFQWPGETQLQSTGQLDIKSTILLPVIFRRILNHCISDGILQGMNQFENLENPNGFDPNNLPLLLTYRHLIGGHILLIKEVNTLHFLTSIMSPGCGEEGGRTTGLMGIPAQGHRHKGVLLQANRSEGALRQVRQALQGPGNWCYKKAMGISQLCCFSHLSKHLVVNFQLTIASAWFFQERS